MSMAAADANSSNESHGLDANAASVYSHALQLPHEATLHLLDYLDAVSLSKCAQTYSTWRKLSSTDLLWKRLCKREFGIDGGKADYASRWQQEKQRALANLKLYVDFLDEIFFSLSGFYALVSVFVVFPTLLVLKTDGWLAISWTQVFGSIYGLGFIAVMFALVRLTLLVTIVSPESSLNKCINYGGIVPVIKCVVWNIDVGHKVAALTGVSAVVSVVPLAIHLFADDYLATPRLAVFLTWASVGCAAHSMKQAAKSRRTQSTMLLLTCAFASSSLLLLKSTVLLTVPWTLVAAPFGLLGYSALKTSAIKQVLFRRLYGRVGASTSSLRRLPSNSDWIQTAASNYYHQHPPLASLALFALKLDGLLSASWALVLLDYVAWLCCGPLALQARHLVQLMFREMPIPASVRKL